MSAESPSGSAAERGWTPELGVRRLGLAARNALEVVRKGRLGAPYCAPFDVVHEDAIARLRHYRAEPDAGAPPVRSPLLLVPPLMVASEIYDIAPELSAVAALGRAGIDVWLVDFGAPEEIEGGMARTLDDHVLAVSQAVDRVHEATGAEVHLLGYSQGGMFAYQAAAYRRSEGLASVITFGSPVDIHRNLPGVGRRAAGRVIGAAGRALKSPLERIEGLPGFLTSTGFKLLSARKEIAQLVDLVAKLHDREALVRRESRRRFLAGEGFVAWPGPAFRTFVDEFVVMNRLASGGFVIEGRTVSLADIGCPILAFVGLKDDIALPRSVRGIHRAATRAPVHEASLPAGHFGLVVGSTAMGVSWPTVVEWVRWRAGVGPYPTLLSEDGKGHRASAAEVLAHARANDEAGAEAAYDASSTLVDAAWSRVSDVSRGVGELVEHLRWQVPRLARLNTMDDRTRTGVGRALAEQARAIPDATFFLWRGRAFSYAAADQRVDNVVRGLVHCGVRADQRVGVLMDARPSYLTIVAAVSRLGAVSVLLSAGLSKRALKRAVALAGVDVLVTDPESAERGRACFAGEVLVLGGGGPTRPLPEGVVDMEAVDPEKVALPQGFRPNPGRARDLALVILTAGRRDEEPRAARITNRRWAASALGSAAACTLTPRDTVYCCLPLHHAAGMLAAVGGALVGGARLAMGEPFDPRTMWEEVRRYGATVVFYAGDMCRSLLQAPPSPADHRHPIRLFAGSGMRVDAWSGLLERFRPAGVLEFYASTEGNCVLANAAGEKVGALGRPLPGTTELRLVEWDFTTDALARDASGTAVEVATDEVGVLIARLDGRFAGLGFDGYTDDALTARRIARGLFAPDDAWFITGDLMRRDADGDYWLVDNLGDTVRTADGPVASRAIEDAIHELAEVDLVAAYGVRLEGVDGEVAVAAVKMRRRRAVEPEALGALLCERLAERDRPRYVVFPKRILLTEGYRPRKAPLREAGVPLANPAAPMLIYDAAAGCYRADSDEGTA